MIPRRVSLRGFLCYREEQEIDFGGATLWMLAGLNGSGKSAIFDAVTFALFGHHRGGASGAAELINKESDGFAVEFDFLLDGELYRIKRTLKRSARGNPSATQQVLRAAPAVSARSAKWEPVPDTSRKAEFDAWVRERIGLTFDTFTSSVLLLQGRAEKLLDSSPRGRFEVLSGIVDLGRYARLHERADQRRKELKVRVEALQAQLEATPPVEPSELEAVQARIAEAAAARDAGRSEVERWQAVEFQARQWEETQARRAALGQRWAQAQALLREAESIERDLDRLRELQAAVPQLEAVIKFRGDLAVSEGKTTALNASRQSYQDKLAVAAAALDQEQKKRAALQKAIARDEQGQRELAGRMQALNGQLAKVELFEAQDREVKQIEADVGKLPTDLDAVLQQARREADELAAAAQAVTPLARLLANRTDLTGARERERHAVGAELAVKALGEQLSAELMELGPQVEEAARARAGAEADTTAARTLLDHAQTQLGDFQSMEGAKVCRHCGQPLTAAHFARELEKRRAEVAAAEARVATCTAARAAAVERERTLATRRDALERQRQAKREEFRDAHRGLVQAWADIERLTRDCGRDWQELPEAYRDRVSIGPPADWLAVGYPADDDVADVRRQAGQLPAARQRLELLQRQAVQATALREQLARHRGRLAVLASEMAAAPDEVRRQHAGAAAEEQALAVRLRAARDESRRNQDELDRLAAERERLARQVAEFDGQLRDEETNRRHWRKGLESASAALPAAWKAHADRAKLADLYDWKAERDRLEGQGTERRAQELRQARSGLDALKQALGDLEAAAESLPPESRRPAGEIQALVRAAKQAAAGCEDRLRAAEQESLLLATRLEQRQRLNEQVLAIDREHSLQAILANLLGRDRLQLYLVRQAERQIVDHANAVLDRLSGGQLFLRLRGGDEGEEADKALELEAYNRTAGGAPINVAFLSGSQRFRVAVSLALGIGQYASRQHRPIQSVIIDEGFGCLDRHGRQVMIQELQNLREHLQCILLVSHQEEFAEAFNDGYRFELEGGTTRATRIQK